MTATSAPTERWAPLTTIRPHYDFDSGGGEIEVSNALLQQRYALSRQAALDLIAGTGLADTGGGPRRAADYFAGEGIWRPAASSPLHSGIAHWQDRGWDPSIDFYLWTRNLPFCDQPSGDTFEEVRDEVLDAFGAEPGVVRPSPRECRHGGRPLGPPADLPKEPLGSVLRRRSCTTTPRRRTLEERMLNSLLWYGLAPIRYPGDDYDSYDALINLGRLYEIFFIAHEVEGIDPGIYYYDTNHNRVEQVRTGALRAEAQAAIIGQLHPLTAACTFAIGADFRLTQWQYRHNRVLRAFYVDAGKIVQHLILVATAHRLTTAMSAAIDDSKMSDLLGLDPVHEQVFFTLSVG